jgi:hypothetical protein
MAKILSYDPMIISGKVGDHVYYSRNGKNFFRKMPVHRKRISSKPMQPQQQKFSLLGKLLLPLTPLFRFSFKKYTHLMSGFNKAISSNYHNGLMGEYPSYAFDFSNLVLGDGYVANARSTNLKLNGSGSLIFTWRGRRSRGSVSTNDHMYIAVFCEELNTWFYETNAAKRSAGTCTIDVPAFKGNAVHIYIGFISTHGNDASMSEYMGMVNV